ncbi:MAG: DUF1989 domain-containing protein [Acidimicrobiales bacterium]|nr:DUF1989 domain-containing protein [Acidimicrobiales bacterium]MYB83129.1 DUF1989 domain-containing protein [Acidimicrobiales bacterium]MYI13739.1 DUF1989 domain-containing protein [Acidimicrobiales bacterium]
MTLLVTAEAAGLVPGLMLLGTGVERYRVTGGGATVLALAAGDELEIVDPEGCQPCELVAFDTGGQSDPGLLEVTNGGAAAFAPADPAAVGILSAPLTDARRVRAGLERVGVDMPALQAATPLRLLDGDTPANVTARVTALDDVACVVAAPGGPMSAHEGAPPTDLIAYVHRRDPAGSDTEPLLPTPLVDPSQDFIVLASTARAYQVSKGDWFQVVDMAGRQCSDFQCFAVADLEAGADLCLDATITRSLMGASYPMPGLYSKFFNANMQPLTEVVQDTVGRHDTFNTACNARFYEEMGYPGHINCTDNINGELEPYGVAARRGWEAINFFYNTQVDDANQIYLDEPWSRPGDYVLLRALEDLVCVSTACPCDVDAANGWNPTDIAVRVYPAANMFKKATAIRMTADSEAQLTKETGFHSRTAALTRSLSEYCGYWLADHFTGHGAVEEYWACRQAAAAIDLSPLRKYEVTGPDAELLMQTCVTRNVRKLADGQVVYTAMCHPTGGMIDDGTVFRIGRENFRWIGGQLGYSGVWLREQAERLGLNVWVRNSTEQLHNLQVQGPNSRRILDEIIWTRPDQQAVSELGWFRFSIARIGDYDGIPLVVSRTGYTGELGYEVFCHPSDAPAVWDAIFEAGTPHGLVPMGLSALDMLRIEAGLVFAGHEFCDQTDPYEAGIGFTVPLKTKEDDFIGRDALFDRRDNPQRRLVGLELDGGEPGALGDGVYVGRNHVGEITSGTISPILRKNIALCRMTLPYNEIGTTVEVGKLDGHEKRIAAEVVRYPFYDPDKSRVRA